MRTKARQARGGACGWVGIAVALALAAAAVCATASPTRAQATDYDRATMVQAFRQFNASVREGKAYSEEASSATLAWGESYYLNAYVKMYRATGDVSWLDLMVAHFDRMLANRSDPDGDGVPSWQTDRYSPSYMEASALHNQGTARISPEETTEYNIDRAHEAVDGEFVVEYVGDGRYTVWNLGRNRRVYTGPFTSGQTLLGIPGFDLTITGSPVAGDKFRVTTRAPQPLDYAVHDGMIIYPIAQFIELALRVDGLTSRYGSKAESYLKEIERTVLLKQERYWVALGNDRGAYRATEAAWERYPNRLLPHNQYLALARAYLVLKDVSDNPLFLTRATQMAHYFKDHLRQTGQAYTWYYWDWTEDGVAQHSGVEDTSHGHIDIEFATEAYRRGVVFDETDMVRFARTLTDQMWNGSLSAPTVGGHVDRQSGTGTIIRGWIELSRWDPRIWDLYWALYKSTGRPGLEIPHLVHLRLVLDGQEAYLVPPSAVVSEPPAAYSLSLDLDPADGDQGLVSLTDVPDAWPFNLQLFGEGLSGAVALTVSVEYDDTLLTFSGFQNGRLFNRVESEVSSEPARVTLQSDTLSQGLAGDRGLLGTLQFASLASPSDARIRLAGATLVRGDRSETLGAGAEVRLSGLSCDFDGNGSVGFPDFLQLARSYGSYRGAQDYDARLDLNGDDLVDFSDFLLFARSYGAQVAHAN